MKCLQICYETLETQEPENLSCTGVNTRIDLLPCRYYLSLIFCGDSRERPLRTERCCCKHEPSCFLALILDTSQGTQHVKAAQPQKLCPTIQARLTPDAVLCLHLARRWSNVKDKPVHIKLINDLAQWLAGHICRTSILNSMKVKKPLNLQPIQICTAKAI